MFWFLFVQLVGATLVQEAVIRGSRTTFFTYDAAATDLSWMLTHISPSGDLYVTGVSGGSIPRVVCRETVTNPVIVAPRGCDAGDESQAILRANCGHKTVTGLTDYWTYEPQETACRLGGSEASCMGPPHLLRTGLPDDAANDLDLLEGVYVRSGVGPDCAIPAVTRVPIKLPTLVLTSDCPFPTAGDYTPDTLAPQRTQYVFIRFATDLILTPRTDGRYNMDALLNGQVLFNATSVQPGTPFAAGGCNLKFVLTAAPRPLQLIPPVVPDGSNYFKVTTQMAYYKTLACGFCVGRRSFDSPRSIIQGVAEGVPFGGFAIFATPEGVPLQVDPDPRYADFDDNCDRFYPRSETFTSIFQLNGGNAVYDRSVPAQFSCYAPFPYPEALLEVDTREARAQQCHMLGMMLATETSDVCVADSTSTLCKRGWQHFAGRCNYKFNEATESTFKAPAGPYSDTVCARLHPNAISSYSITLAQSAWLQHFFAFWRFPGTVTRVVLVGRSCECYSAVGVVSCDCDTPNFPLCSYHVKDVPIPWASISFHPSTLRVLRDGQVGVQRSGMELECGCLTGSSGGECTTPTCVPPPEIAASTNASLMNPYIRFFKKCYAHGRGVCRNSDVNQCGCTPGFGPHANLLTGKYVDTPCMFPTGTGSAQILVDIGGNLSTTDTAVCSGAKNGVAVVYGWNKGRCDCRTRWSKFGGTEPDWGGSACSCPMPDYQEGHDVVEVLCNNHGTCCPQGERADGGLGGCVGKSDGCGCDPGYAGLACTSEVPHPVRPVEPIWVGEDNRTYVYFRFLTTISKVYVPSQVTLVTADTTICAKQALDDWESDRGAKWLCGDVQAKYVYATGPNPSKIQIEVFSENYGPCGLHPNPHAARFMSVPQFRSPGKYIKVQPFKFAQFGSTTSHTICAPGFMGGTCSIGISSYRIEESTARLMPQMCGESTLPRRGTVVDKECGCGWLGDSIAFNGTSCECALVDGYMCGGIGRCMAAAFPYGSCASDLQDLSQDALSKPYRGGPGWDCSNPVDRALMDVYVNNGSLVSPCAAQPIKAYSNTIGIGYGIFHNLIPKVDFSLEVWSARHYSMLSSLFGAKRCDAFGDELWDLYLADIVRLPAAQLTEFRRRLVEDGLFSVPMSACTGPTIDTSHSVDQTYLRKLHAAAMSRRRCTTDSECEQFSPLESNLCVFDSTEHIPWRNGDPKLPVQSTYGDEGGCECRQETTGFFDAQTFCSTCAVGYGPDSTFDRMAMVRFNKSLGIDWIEGGLGSVARCSLPVDSQSSRVSTICGGRGRVRRGDELQRVIRRFRFGNVRRKCEALAVAGVMYTLVNRDATGPFLQLYRAGAATLDVVGERLFQSGIEVEDWTCVDDVYRQEFERGVWVSNGVTVIKRPRGMFTVLW